MNIKFRLLLFSWLLQFVNYLDRTSISVAGPTMVKSLGFDASQFGLLLAAFALGYAIMQIPGGFLADRFGTKAMLVVAPVLFSVFTGATGLATTLAALIAARLCFGLSEGAINSGFYKLIGDNFTHREAARAHSMWLTAFALGPALVAPIATAILRTADWRTVFFVFAVPGVIVALLVFFLIPRDAIEGQRHTLTSDERRAQWRAFARQPSTWMMFFGYFTFSVGYWGFLGWVPSYLVAQRHIDLKALGLAASIPYLFGCVGILVYGRLGSGWLYRRQPALLATSVLAAGATLYVAYSAHSIQSCVIALSATAFLLYGCLTPYAALVVQLAPAGARGMFAGTINTGGQIGGLLAPLAVGYLVKASNSYNSGFGFMIGAMAASAACYGALQIWMSSRVPKREDVEAKQLGGVR